MIFAYLAHSSARQRSPVTSCPRQKTQNFRFAGEALDTIDFSETPETNEADTDEEKIEALAEMICRAGDEAGTKSAALLVLMSTLEHSSHPKALANIAKHLAFTRCGELNFHNMVDAQIDVLQGELLMNDAIIS